MKPCGLCYPGRLCYEPASSVGDDAIAALGEEVAISDREPLGGL